MGFTFAARTLLELGRELISTDEVAIYEIIKNSVDATRLLDKPSEKVRLTAQIAITRSDHLEVLGHLKSQGVDAAYAKFAEAIQPDLPATVREPLLERIRTAAGRDVAEFSAELERTYVEYNWMEFADDGHGMSLTDLSDIYLRIGTRSRRADNVAGSEYLGDKGVGRLSAMRLGDLLEVKTTRAGERQWNVLTIPWSSFSHDSDLDADEIDIVPRLGPAKGTHATQGTVIRISDLLADWTKVEFASILQGRIARMIDPFIPGNANTLMKAVHNGAAVRIPSIPQKLLASAHASAKVTFEFVEGEPVLTGSVSYAMLNQSRTIDARGTEVYSITQRTTKRRAKKGHAAVQFQEIPRDALEQLGRFECEIYWFNRRIVQNIEDLTENATQTRAEIASWAGGPMLYRYGFRVLPYGDRDDDWLALDQNAFGEKGFKLNRQQVIGRVRVWSAHTALSEQTNREGLMASPAQDALTRMLKWLLHVELRSLINDADDEERINKRKADEDVTGLRAKRDAVEAALTGLADDVGPGHELALKRVQSGVGALSEHATSLVGRLDDVMKEAEDEREKFVYLAGVGLMTEFIFHELERAVSFTINTIVDVPPHEREAALESLVDQLRTLNKRIAAFDELTGEKRQTRSDFDLADVVETVLTYHRREFERHRFDVQFERPSKPLRIRAVRGMVIQIIENLLTNATYWLKRQQTYEEGFRPVIVLAVDPDERTLTIEDNGPGVAPDRAERIFQPFVTSKPAGQGRGLGLHISRELAGQHKWKLHMDDTVGRTRPNRLNMFVLDMG